ncbi:MAG: helix-turn-helix domain-containing protein [Bacteroidota bacterium]
MNFATNVKLLRKRKGRTQDDVAFALQMKRSTLSGYENQVAQPTIKALIIFSDYFNISIDTLVKIDLQKLSQSQLSELENGYDVYVKGSRLRVLASTVDSRNNENIELVEEKAKAGYTSGFADPEYISELPVFQLPFLSREKKYRTFQISGDSMLPIPDRALVTGEFLLDWSLIKDGKAYIVLTLNEGIVFKILQNHIEAEGKIRLISLNPLYNPYDLEISEVKEIWAFVHYINSEIPEPSLPQDKLLSIVASLKHDVDWLKRKVDKL